MVEEVEGGGVGFGLLMGDVVEVVAVVEMEEVAVSVVVVAGTKTDTHWYLFRLILCLM